MPRIAYVNGRYVAHAGAAVHIEDRGYQFGDAVYEVCEIARGSIVDLGGHLDRLNRSLSELSIGWPIARSALIVVMREVIRRNHVADGMVYLQVSRGVAGRDHFFPPPGTRPSLVVTAKKVDPAVNEGKAATGLKIITVPESRWNRVDIKSVGLLPNVLAKQQARLAGAHDAWFVDRDGFVTESASANAWIVTGEGVLVTRPASHDILQGITRTTLMKVAAKLKLKVEERAFTVAEARAAREAFSSSATTIAMPVVEIDGHAVANGHPGSVTLSLRQAFFDVAEKSPA